MRTGIISLLILFNFVVFCGSIEAQTYSVSEQLKSYNYSLVDSLLKHHPEQFTTDQKVEGYKMTQQFDKAIQLLDSISQTEDAEPYTAIQLGDLCAMSGYYSKAFEAYAKAVESSPNMLVLVKMANIKIQDNDLPQAIALLNRSLEIDTLAQNLRLLASCYARIDSLQLSFDHYSRALQMNPSDYRTVSDFAQFYLDADSINTALALLTEFREKDTTNISVNRLYAKGLFQNENYPDALTAYDYLTDQGDNSYNTLLYKGIAYFYCDSMQQAYTLLQRIRKIEKKTDPNVLVYLGIAAFRLYETNESIEYLEAAKELLIPNDVTMELIYSNLARAYGHKQDNAKKLAMLRSAYSHVNKPLTLYNMAFTYDALGNSKAAIDYYQRYVNVLSKKKDLSKIESGFVESASNRITELKTEEFFKQ